MYIVRGVGASIFRKFLFPLGSISQRMATVHRHKLPRTKILFIEVWFVQSRVVPERCECGRKL